MLWLERLNDKLVIKGQENVPVCCGEEGILDQAYQYQENFVYYLMEIQQKLMDITS